MKEKCTRRKICWSSLLALTLLSTKVHVTSSLYPLFWPQKHSRIQSWHSSTFTKATSLASVSLLEYCELVQESIDTQQFVSLHLEGPSKKGTAATKEQLRGCIANIHGRLVASAASSKASSSLSQVQQHTFYLQMTFKYHSATDVAKNWKQPNLVGKKLMQLLEGRNDTSSTLDYQSEWGVWHPIGSKFGLQSCKLTTLSEVVEYDFKKSKLTKKASANRTKSPSSVQHELLPMTISNHDRTKQLPVSPDAPFWKAIGLEKMTAKRRQCQKFVEIVASLISQLTSRSESDGDAVTRISTIDMGCGRGYLTFALHHYLKEQWDHVTTRGIDMRPKLVNEMNSIAASLHNMQGLTFETGTIEDFLANTAKSTTSELDEKSNKSDNSINNEVLHLNKDHPIHLLIALHACDTATDDAIWSGIKSQAQIIVVAPCCHKQIRPQLDTMVASQSSFASSHSHPFLAVLRHGIYRERLAETVTDSIRAILLEMAHYNVKVFEFIGGEHTSKNVMITAVKRTRQRSAKEVEDLRQNLIQLALSNGIQFHKLATWMDLDLGQGTKRSSLSLKGMPPL